ncbi:MAG: nickel pincer cofactor biosynthesis protein LarB [Candidatus Undinarchaeales archaeon]|jgi:hypothetical protein|nr:nickel pincer cofactor biosynthesis protein LarB [Candidatus Undinarchaeales archaeon]MDP7493589.1 nickel pincer cofactor biosynthesis protein LarB [Candidatus Undinarchaeales archaeon]
MSPSTSRDTGPEGLTTPEEVLDSYRNGSISREEAVDAMQELSVLSVGSLARIDLNREARCGVPEVVYGEGKRLHELGDIVTAMLGQRGKVIITRLSPESRDALLPLLKDADVEYDDDARALVARRKGLMRNETMEGTVAVLTAGTSDIPIAAECAFIARELGLKVVMFNDVGVAGVHRLVPCIKSMVDEKVDCIVVVAGMEGALPSLVAGLVDVPVIGVPTSIGYGANLGGMTTLLSMLSSCAPGLAVVNVDNGFGAAVFARKVCIAHRRREGSP